MIERRPIKSLWWKFFIDVWWNFYSIEKSKRWDKQNYRKLTPKMKDWYVTYNFWINWETKSRFIHRIMAEEFIPNPLNKPFVNHKNWIKDDNRIENLERVTRLENARHWHKTGFWNKTQWQLKFWTGKKAVIQMDLEWNFLREFESISEAAKYMWLEKPDRIWGCCRGLFKTCAWYKWNFKENTKVSASECLDFQPKHKYRPRNRKK